MSYNIAAEEICLITDQFWNMMIDNEQNENSISKLKNKIIDDLPFISRQYIRIGGRRIRKLIITTESISNTDFIIDEVSAADVDIIILSPLLSGMVSELSEKLPELFFITTAAVGSADNVSIFTADYSDAYFKAGEWAASQDYTVHAVFFTGSDRLLRAKESFSSGWSLLKEPQELNLTIFNRIDEVTAEFIDQYLNSFEGEKMVAAVFAGPHNESFLNRFDGTSILLLSEYMKKWGESSYNEIGSIELPATDFLSVIVKSVSTGTYRDGGVVKAEFFSYESQ